MDETTTLENSAQNKHSDAQLIRIRSLRTRFLLTNIFFGLFALLVTLFSIYILTDRRFRAIANETKQIHRSIFVDMQVWIILLFVGRILTMSLSIVGITGKPSLIRMYCIIIGVLVLIDLIAFCLIVIMRVDATNAVKEVLYNGNNSITDVFQRLENRLDCWESIRPETHCSQIILNYFQERIFLVALSILGCVIFECFGTVSGLLLLRTL